MGDILAYGWCLILLALIVWATVDAYIFERRREREDERRRLEDARRWREQKWKGR